MSQRIPIARMLFIVILGILSGETRSDDLSTHWDFIGSTLQDFLEQQAQSGNRSAYRAEAQYLLGMLTAFSPQLKGVQQQPTGIGKAQEQALKHFEAAFKIGNGHVGACERIAEIKSIQCGGTLECHDDIAEWRKRCRLVPVRWEEQLSGGEKIQSECLVRLKDSKRCPLPKTQFHDLAPASLRLVPGYELDDWIAQDDDRQWKVEPTQEEHVGVWRFKLIAERYGVQSVPHELIIRVARTGKDLEKFGYSMAIEQVFGELELEGPLQDSGFFEPVARRSDIETIKSISGRPSEKNFPMGLVFGNTLLDAEVNSRFFKENKVQLPDQIALVAPMSEVVGVLIFPKDRPVSPNTATDRTVAIVVGNDSDSSSSASGGTASAFFQLFPAWPAVQLQPVANFDLGCWKLVHRESDALFVLTQSGLGRLKENLAKCATHGGGFTILPAMPESLPPGFFKVRLTGDPELDIAPDTETAATEVWWVMHVFESNNDRCRDILHITSIRDYSIYRKLRGDLHLPQQPESSAGLEPPPGKGLEEDRSTKFLYYHSSRLEPQLKKAGYQHSDCATIQ